jgi:hypothetical protein
LKAYTNRLYCEWGVATACGNLGNDCIWSALGIFCSSLNRIARSFHKLTQEKQQLAPLVWWNVCVIRMIMRMWNL